METYTIQILGIALLTVVFCIVTLAVTVQKGQI